MTTATPASALSPAVRIGPQGLPERTLGWQILGWVEKYLRQPDGPDAGEPFVLTNEQARFLLHWYAVDEHDRFVNHSGVLRRMKGWGKDPLGAVLCAVEFVGPCRPDPAGRPFRADEPHPLAVPHPAAWVQTAAVSKEQTRNTMTLFPGLFSKEAIAEFAIDLGKEIIYAHRGRCRVEAVTSSPRALEGGRATFVLMNETHHWLENNEGIAMSEVIARNAAKARDGSSRTLQITNAHNPAEDSVAARAWEAYLMIAEGRSKASGFLYDSLEAPPDLDITDERQLRHGIECARGDSAWLDIEALVATILMPTTSVSDTRRFYLNQIHAKEDAWLSEQEFDPQSDPWHPVGGALVTLGFDGSLSDDHTALMGCDVESGHVFTVRVWDPEQYGGEAPREEIAAAVVEAIGRWDVVGFYSDVSPWESYVDRWEQEYGEQLCVRAQADHPIAWDMRTRRLQTAKAAEAFRNAILDGAMTHDGVKPLEATGGWGDGVAFRSHVLNARNNPRYLGMGIDGHPEVVMTFGKDRNRKFKVDALAAAVLARQCRQDYLALPESKKRRGASGSQIFVV